MTKIINLYGAPGSGKSTIASGLFFHMKIYLIHNQIFIKNNNQEKEIQIQFFLNL